MDKMEWHDLRAKNDENIRMGIIVGIVLGAALVGTLWFYSYNETPVKYECTWEQKSKYCMPYLEDANDNYEYALSLLDECESKAVPPLDNSEMLKWKAKYNNIVPLYQKCDKDYRNFTNYHNMYFVDYRYLGLNCQSTTVERTITNTVEVIKEVPVPVPTEDDEDHHNWHHHEWDEDGEDDE